jgi:hypothetical protein
MTMTSLFNFKHVSFWQFSQGSFNSTLNSMTQTCSIDYWLCHESIRVHDDSTNKHILVSSYMKLHIALWMIKFMYYVVEWSSCIPCYTMCVLLNDKLQVWFQHIKTRHKVAIKHSIYDSSHTNIKCTLDHLTQISSRSKIHDSNKNCILLLYLSYNHNDIPKYNEG